LVQGEFTAAEDFAGIAMAGEGIVSAGGFSRRWESWTNWTKTGDIPENVCLIGDFGSPGSLAAMALTFVSCHVVWAVVEG
jgi:hypothetical protein